VPCSGTPGEQRGPVRSAACRTAVIPAAWHALFHVIASCLREHSGHWPEHERFPQHGLLGRVE
jgi:hypothetical protein